MGKFVLGIIAIACLDVAFIAYTFIANTFGREAVVSAVDTKANDHPDLSWMHDVVRSSSPDKLEKVISTRPRRHQIGPQTAIGTTRSDRVSEIRQTKYERRPRSRQVRAINGTTGTFASGIRIIKEPNRTLILYHKPQPASENRKTSYLARVMPAFKKPWDWIRSFPSKLR
jgi:hypothetical protein